MVFLARELHWLPSEVGKLTPVQMNLILFEKPKPKPEEITVPEAWAKLMAEKQAELDARNTPAVTPSQPQQEQT